MSRVPDELRKRDYRPRPSRRVEEPTRPYAFRLGGVQADWLDQYLADLGDFPSRTQKLSAFVAAAIQQESGIHAGARVHDGNEMAEMREELEASLKSELKRFVMRLLKDRQQVEAVHEAHNIMAKGGAVDDAVIDNILQGFDNED